MKKRDINMDDELISIDEDYMDDEYNSVKRMTLMHKDVPVMDVVLVNDHIDAIGTVHNADHLPVMRMRFPNKPDKWDFISWWDSRGIPRHRFDINDIFDNIPVEYRDCSVLQTINLGLSLSDQYWVKSEGADVLWSDVNYFENDFGTQLGDWCIGDCKIVVPEDVCLIGPSSSLGGNQKKAWKIVDGKRVMVKESRPPYYQEAINEVIGSRVCDALGLPHIKYDILEYKGILYSVCECDISPDEDLVSLYDLSNTVGAYEDTIAIDKCRQFLADRNIDDNLDGLVIVDYLLRNSDRHLRNVSVVRSAVSNDFIRMFPAFDFGNSLWHDVATDEIENNIIVNKLTGRMYEDDLRRIKFMPFDARKLLLVPGIVKNTLEEFGYKRDRTQCIYDCVDQRLDVVMKFFGLNFVSNREINEEYDYKR